MSAKLKAILCRIDGQQCLIIGTIRDTKEWSIGAGQDIAEIFERDAPPHGQPIRIGWSDVLGIRPYITPPRGPTL